MKAIVLAGAAALALSACAQLTARTGISEEAQACLATNALAAADVAKGAWGGLTTPQKAAYIAQATDEIATLCGVDASKVQPYLAAAVQAAALVE